MLFIFFFTTYAFFFQGGGWNQNSRICLTRAILHDRTFIIDNYMEDSQDPYFEFVNTGDWSYYNGHYYTVRPPGLSFMAVVPFGIAEYFFKHYFPADTERQVLLSSYASTLCTSSLCATLLCLMLFHFFYRFFNIARTSCLFLTIFFGLGTYAFCYSTSFYSYLPAAFFSFLAFLLAIYLKQGCSHNKKLISLFSGLSASLAVLVEASTLLILICILSYLLSFKDGRRYMIFFLLGCLPTVILLCFYNTVCFGSPFSTSYKYANDAVMWYTDGSLFSMPNVEDFMGILILPYRGLFISSPILFMALPGISLFFKKRKLLAEAMLCTSVLISYILLIASYNAWHGGTTVGPRYLVPAFPFVFILTVFAFQHFPKTFKALGLLSIIINLSITLVGNEIPIDIANPLYDGILKNILEGTVSINPVPFSNFNNYSDLDQLSNIEKWPRNFNSFNIGELIFPHSITSILPLFCFWAIWGYLWSKINTKRRDSKKIKFT
jgi:hypothetical protein